MTQTFGRELTRTRITGIVHDMNRIEEIEEAVERLSSKEFSSFRTWFSTYDASLGMLLWKYPACTSVLHRPGYFVAIAKYGDENFVEV
jgi:hypothetical protein